MITVIFNHLTTSAISTINGSTSTTVDYAKSGSDFYKKWLAGAQWYMNLQKNDELWVGKTPKLADYGVLYYTDDETIPAYIEYKIMCGKSDCGSVVVNIDGNDVLVPEWATHGRANFEVLASQIASKKSHLYRFGLLDQYIVDSETDAIGTINTDKKDFKKSDFLGLKEKVRQYKRSDAFRQQKESLSSPQLLQLSGNISTLSTTPTNVYIPGQSTANCPSRTPCYAQYTDTYYWSTCYLGCSPNALAIVYGYYDRQGTFPNLISGLVATDISYTWSINGTWFARNSAIQTMSNAIRTQMSTSCVSGQGWTNKDNIKYGIQYAKNQWYTNSTSSNLNTTPNVILQAVKTEVNASRPIILSSTSHSFVAYGYSSDTTSYMVRVNYGLTVNQDTSYFGRDVSLSSASLPAVGGAFEGYTLIRIAQ